jgi:hypothetical protein
MTELKTQAAYNPFKLLVSLVVIAIGLAGAVVAGVLAIPYGFLAGIMGLEEEILPHRSSIEEGNIEEERRLMYVGITRARETLTLTYAGQRRQYGEKIETIPSRFLDELPEDDVRREGMGDLDQEANQQKGKATLSALLGDLGG